MTGRRSAGSGDAETFVITGLPTPEEAGPAGQPDAAEHHGDDADDHEVHAAEGQRRRPWQGHRAVRDDADAACGRAER